MLQSVIGNPRARIADKTEASRQLREMAREDQERPAASDSTKTGTEPKSSVSAPTPEEEPRRLSEAEISDQIEKNRDVLRLRYERQRAYQKEDYKRAEAITPELVELRRKLRVELTMTPEEAEAEERRVAEQRKREAGVISATLFKVRGADLYYDRLTDDGKVQRTRYIREDGKWYSDEVDTLWNGNVLPQRTSVEATIIEIEASQPRLTSRLQERDGKWVWITPEVSRMDWRRAFKTGKRIPVMGQSELIDLHLWPDGTLAKLLQMDGKWVDELGREVEVKPLRGQKHAVLPCVISDDGTWVTDAVRMEQAIHLEKAKDVLRKSEDALTSKELSLLAKESARTETQNELEEVEKEIRSEYGDQPSTVAITYSDDLRGKLAGLDNDIAELQLQIEARKAEVSKLTKDVQWWADLKFSIPANQIVVPDIEFEPPNIPSMTQEEFDREMREREADRTPVKSADQQRWDAIQHSMHEFGSIVPSEDDYSLISIVGGSASYSREQIEIRKRLEAGDPTLVDADELANQRRAAAQVQALLGELN